MLEMREIEGEFHTLKDYPSLIDDEIKFLQYFQMDISTLKIIIKTEEEMSKANTTSREAIIPKLKLAVCLWYFEQNGSGQWAQQ